MLAASEDRIEDALNDVIACHRLARHVASGQILIELLVVIAIIAILIVTTQRQLAWTGLGNFGRSVW